jgi:hypothetical protein
MNMLDLIYRCDQWGMGQNHAGRRNNNRIDDPNLLLKKGGMRQNHVGRSAIVRSRG